MNFRNALTLAAIFCLSTLKMSAQERVACPEDTILYVKAKTLAIDTLTFKPNETSAAYQYFECPQPITVRGARFYGLKPNLDSGATITMTVELVRSSNDTVPSSNPIHVLASANYTFETPDSLNGPLSQYAAVVTWAPTLVDAPYMIVVRTATNNPPFSLLHNHLDGANSDGNREWLAGVQQGLSWIRPYNLVVDTQSLDTFDADFLFEPIVSYNINAGFTNDPECLFDELGEDVDFFNTGSPITDSRMYNRYSYYNLPLRQRWNFGDGSPLLDQIDPTHPYPTNGPYVASLTTRMSLWTGGALGFCQSSVSQIIKEKPEQDFSYVTNNLDVQFSNETSGNFSNIMYNFGDGNSSLSENPKHKYSEPGTYWVCQSMTTSCGDITWCRNVAVATSTALNCGKDSVQYTAAKASDIKMVQLKNTAPNRLYGLGQKFEAPQSMIVHGFSFYANHAGLFRDSYPVTCRIYDNVNGLPDSVDFIAESTVYINKYELDTNYSNKNKYTAIFNLPANVKEDYILTIEYDSSHPIQIATSDWLAHDGAGELKGIGKINDSTWVIAPAVNGAAFDADVIIEPLVEYNLDANFTYDFLCLDTNATVNFYDNSSLIARSDVYNTIAFNTASSEAFEWNFDDGSPIQRFINPSHNFQGVGPFDVSLVVKMEGWTKTCIASQVHNTPVHPVGGFTYEQVTNTVKFTDLSMNADEYLWTFTDSTISTLKNPTHYFMSARTFEVCQYVSNECGSDTVCDSITVNIVGIPYVYASSFDIYPNPARDYLNIKADFSVMSNMSVAVMDLSGRQVKRVGLTSANPSEQLYVGDLARGTYLVKIKADDYEGTRKIVLMGN